MMTTSLIVSSFCHSNSGSFVPAFFSCVYCLINYVHSHNMATIIRNANT